MRKTLFRKKLWGMIISIKDEFSLLRQIFDTCVCFFYFVQVMFIPKLIKFVWVDSFWSLIFTKTVARPVFRWAFLNNSKSQPSSSRSKLNWNILALKIDKFVKANYKGRCKNQNLNKIALIASKFSSKYKNSSSA